MDLTTVTGLTAGALTTISFIPQVVKIWNTKSADDISIATFAAFCVGVALWLAYGIMLKELPIVITNGVTLVLALAILAMKIKFD